MSAERRGVGKDAEVDHGNININAGICVFSYHPSVSFVPLNPPPPPPHVSPRPYYVGCLLRRHH
jgi:hypothetical protein